MQKCIAVRKKPVSLNCFKFAKPEDKILDNSAGIFQSSGSGPMGNEPAALPVTRPTPDMAWFIPRIYITIFTSFDFDRQPNSLP